jgi:uncharacterized membrane protein (DUF373 family)
MERSGIRDTSTAEGEVADGSHPEERALRQDRQGAPRRTFALQTGVGAAQSTIYVAVAALLIAAAAFILVGTVQDLIEGSHSRPISDTGLFILDRVLLLFIIAELLYTLRLVDAGGEILVEPFLLIGLIAIVRRLLIIAAELEGAKGQPLTDFLIQIGALAGLAFVLVVSIYLLRRSAREP